MWSRSYRKHVIMAFPSFDTVTNLWAAQADISWPCGAARESAFVRFPTRAMSEAEAVALALNRGKSWIDRRLRGERRDRLLERVMELRAPKSPPAAQDLSSIAPALNKEKIFTFGQFKAALLHGAPKPSEASLHKSYAALMKLAKAGCPPDEIKQKIKHSQERLAAKRNSRKVLSLPLTEEAWRRLV